MLCAMNQLPLFKPATLTVADLNRYLRQLLESDPILQDLWVQGEVSNYSKPASGHIYFTLKDNSAAMRCVMWRNSAARLAFPVRDGMAVEVHGSLNVYEAGGQVQLYVDAIRPGGEGALFQKFLQLKARLEAEGLFDPARKRPLPPFPHRIGIVTSPTGAALQDILNVLRRRFPLAEVFIAPTPVQGEDAPPAIVAALQLVNLAVHPDVILLARGGGSLEDLWPFNDERVARAIVASPAPVVTGVGHETDFTIADFAADLRAPTPTAAAELVSPNLVDLHAALEDQSFRLRQTFQGRLADLRWGLETRRSQLHRFSPGNLIRNNFQRLDDISRRGRSALEHSLLLRRTRLEGLRNHMESLNPQAVLARGYAIVTHPDSGEVVNSVRQVLPGDDLEVQVVDGAFPAQALLPGSHPLPSPGR
jgi:exodeoxyribonuclease VII large subunit